MTKLLSELLGAEEPTFSINLRQLEKASGAPNADIRLTTQILQTTQAKLRDLSLDPNNTNSQELYDSLKKRLLSDNERLQEHLGLSTEASSQEILAGVRRFVRGLDIPTSCFAIKNSTIKRLLHTAVPTKAMKRLGYRSAESMLKHEPAVGILAAGFVYESASWQRQLSDLYKSLRSSDFESRHIEFFYPTSDRWEGIAREFASRWHHTSLGFRELGEVVILPINESVPALAITSVLLILESVNDIRCASTFLKLQQVKPDFGAMVAEVASGGSYTAAQLVGLPLPWRALQQYFDSKPDYNTALFEPHVQPEDLKLAHAEVALAKALPALEFWVGTPALALVENGQPVSMNMLDVAINAVNDLPFEARSVHHARARVWHELLMRYLNQDNLAKVVGQLSGDQTEQPTELAKELA